MKTVIQKLMPFVSSAACCMAFAMIGTTCRTWLYQPLVPAKLQKMSE